jgi:hypothetical protein
LNNHEIDIKKKVIGKKNMQVIPASLFIFFIFTSSSRAGNNDLIISGGINHNFSQEVKGRAVSRADFIDAYSVNLQYNRQLSRTIGVGFRTIYSPVPTMYGNDLSSSSVPVFVVLNYRLLEIDSENQVHLIQFAVGPVYHIFLNKSSESENSDKDYKTGYGVGIFSGYSFGVWDMLGVYIEGGLLYEKYNFKSVNVNIRAVFNIGFSLIY